MGVDDFMAPVEVAARPTFITARAAARHMIPRVRQNRRWRLALGRGRGALEELIQEIQRGETAGFAPLPPDCPSFGDCSPYTCTLKSCQPQWRNPCLVDAGCKIAEFGRIG